MSHPGGGEPPAGERVRVPRIVYAPPALPPDHVRRGRLLATLLRALTAPLTLVTGPGGAGKTTLVRSWVDEIDVPWAWATLDASLADPAALAAATTGALARIDARFTAHVEGFSSGQPVTEQALVALVDDIHESITSDVVVVLDEVDHVQSSPAFDVLRFVGRHLPPTVHVVALSRHEVDWPVARLRAQGRLVEIGMADLRFTADEATRLAQMQHDALDPRVMASVTDRLGGWPAAIRLAIEGSRRSDDPTEALARFDVSHPDLADFIDVEVVATLPADIIDFLGDVVALDRLSVDRGHDLTGRTDVDEMLRLLAKWQLIVPHDGGDASLLRPLRDHVRLALGRHEPDTFRERARLAAEQHERRGEYLEAVNACLGARDIEDGLAILLRHHVALRAMGHDATIRRWLADIVEMAPADPTIDIDIGYLAGLTGDLTRAMLHLNRAATAIGDGPGPLLQRLSWRRVAVLAQLGELEGALAADESARTLAALDAADSADRDLAAAQAWLQVVRVLTAGGRYDEAVARFTAAGDSPTALAGSTTYGRLGALAELYFDQGEVDEARAHADSALAAWRSDGSPMTWSAVDALRTKAMVELEAGRFAQAGLVLDEADLLLADVDVHGIAVARTVAARSTLLRSTGDAEGAVNVLEGLRRAWVAEPWPRPGPVVLDLVAAERARAHLDAGDLDRAEQALVRLRGTPTSMPTATIIEARVALARGDMAQAARLTSTPMEVKRHDIEAALVLAGALSVSDSTGAAVAAARALTLGLDAGFHFTFVAEHHLLPTYRGIAARRPSQALTDVIAATARAAAASSRRRGVVAIPLTERERQVLWGLAGDLSMADLAAELGVTQNTLKSHVRAVYRKLGVDSRASAVRAGRRVGVLPSG